MDSTTAADIARAATGHDPGPMRVVESASHEVYVGAEVVVKMIDVGDHSRLGREVALVPHLPIGLTARLVDSGEGRWGSRDVRFACFSRVAGASPGMGLPGVDEAAAVVWAEDAVRQLGRLHGWVPPAVP